MSNELKPIPFCCLKLLESKRVIRPADLGKIIRKCKNKDCPHGQPIRG